jgi:hypothetical protein
MGKTLRDRPDYNPPKSKKEGEKKKKINKNKNIKYNEDWD